MSFVDASSFRLASAPIVAQDRSGMIFEQDRSSSESDFEAVSREEIANHQAQLRSESEQFRRRSHPPATLRILKKWLHAHSTNPYPNDDEKTELCRLTNLDRTQLNNWFINARRRILYRADGEQEAGENQNSSSGPGRSHQQRAQEARNAAEALTQLSPRQKKKSRAARRSEPYHLAHHSVSVSSSCSTSSPCSPSSTCSSGSDSFGAFNSMDSPMSSPVKVSSVDPHAPTSVDANYVLENYPPFCALLLVVGQELNQLQSQKEEPMMS